MVKKYLKKMGIVLMTGLLLCGCSSQTINNEQSSEDGENDIEIGMCFDSFVIERWQKDRDVFTATASELGATVNVQNANGDIEKQINQIEYLIDKNVDCLVIIPIDGDALASTIEKAEEKGIPVICYDRLINNVNTDLYISFDNEKVGQMMGEALVNEGATKVVMICGPLTDSNVSRVNSGFMKVMEENNVEILDTYNCEGWKAELGGSYVYDNMPTISQADAIMCGNDDVATSVIRALAVSQMAGNIPVVGQDADLPACQHIVDKTQSMTVYKPVGKLAEQAAKLAVKLASGEKIAVDEMIQNGDYEIPYVAVEPVPVTADNIDEVIIEGGFHTREDVYLNVTEE
ncbi:MAG: substrate-binding domain-containing protein [Pseudobutyrivibrio sp.]|nr:substrate-binding domain-containing protein [Pseudobutyrivibrio sp.]